MTTVFEKITDSNPERPCAWVLNTPCLTKPGLNSSLLIFNNINPHVLAALRQKHDRGALGFPSTSARNNPGMTRRTKP